MNRHNLLCGVSMTATERSQGRYLRAPEGHGDTGTQGGQTQQGNTDQSGNNTPGNVGDSSATQGQDQNNAGQGFDYSGFWSEPTPAGDRSSESNQGSQSQTPANGTSSGGDQQQQGSQYGQQLASRLEALRFDDLFTPAIADEIAQGKLEGLNQRAVQMQREAVKQGLIMSAQLMQTFGTSLVTQVRGMIDQALGTRDNKSALVDAFPSARDPAVRPMIEGVFNQALKHSNGNRDKAISLTRDMLKFMGQRAADDMNLGRPPSNQDDTFIGDGPSALVEELLARN